MSVFKCVSIIHKHIKKGRARWILVSGCSSLWPATTAPLLLVQNLPAIDEGVVAFSWPCLAPLVSWNNKPREIGGLQVSQRLEIILAES